MKMALAAGALACATASADEIITTLDPGWELSYGWTAVGQTITVPESNMLESFIFVGENWGHSLAEYSISVYEWDDEGQHVIGEPLFWDWDDMPNEPEIRFHEIDLLLPRGLKIAVVIKVEYDEIDESGIAYHDGNPYDEGSFIATSFSMDDPWVVQEGNTYDMAFAATFRSCKADMYNDGQLNIFDYLVFQAAFTAGNPDADCNGDGILNVLDFVCFQELFLEGC